MVVGHISKLMALCATKFLRYRTNSGTISITGKKRMNGLAIYGVELLYQYTVKGDDYSLVTACYVMYVE